MTDLDCYRMYGEQSQNCIDRESQLTLMHIPILKVIQNFHSSHSWKFIISSQISILGRP